MATIYTSDSERIWIDHHPGGLLRIVTQWNKWRNKSGWVGDPAYMNRNEARELAAILLHFADTGELPGEVGDDK